MSGKSILLILVLFIPTYFSTASEEKKEREFDLTKCEERSGKDYWYDNLQNQFTKRFKEIKKSESETYWTNGKGCYIAQTDEIADKTKRLHGYAIFLIRVEHAWYLEIAKNQIGNILTTLNMITGENFNSIDEYIIWFYSNSEQSRLEDFKEADARIYWYDEYPKTKNLEFMVNEEIFWCFPNPGYSVSCKKANLTDIEDSEPRAKGYTQRIENDIGRYECSPSTYNNKSINTYNSLFAEDYSSFEQFYQWWLENREYIYWSNEEDKFLVDNELKKKRRPIRTFDIDVKSDQDIGSNTYWSTLIRHEGGELPISDRGNYFRVCAMGPHVLFSFTVSKSYAENQQNKENGYKTILENKINHYSDHIENYAQRSLEDVYFPEHILDQEFETVEQLVIWYNKNKDNLVLSKDGEKLVVKEASD